MRLTVKQLKNREPGSGMAVVDREALSELGVASGDFVAIEGRDGGRTVARVWPSDSADAGRGIVRIDGQLRQAANVNIDDRVAVSLGFGPFAGRSGRRIPLRVVDTEPDGTVDVTDSTDVETTDRGADEVPVEDGCREAATDAVREYVAATADGREADVDDVELTMDHFERALEAVESGADDRRGFGDPVEATETRACPDRSALVRQVVPPSGRPRRAETDERKPSPALRAADDRPAPGGRHRAATRSDCPTSEVRTPPEPTARTRPGRRAHVNVEFLGGAREVGRSAILVDGTLLLDYGMTTDTPSRYPVGSPDPEAVVVSHGHLDHAGAVPGLLSGSRRPEVHWTPPTAELTRELARDTLKLQGNSPSLPFHEQELKRLGEVSRLHGYREPFEVAGYEVTFFDAGHIPGSAHVLVDDGETRLLYTGDFHTEDQQLVAGTTARPDADVVVTESTYADFEREARGDLEAAFAESVRTTLWEGGTVVAPAFAIGRTQEVMCICEQSDLKPYVDGMGVEVTERFRRHPEFLRDPATLRRAKSNARFVEGRDGQRERIADQGSVVITTSGMLNGGPAMTYVPAVRGHPVNKITLTGYQVEGTPGRELLETGSAEIDGRVMPVSAQVEYYDFSAHADRDGLLSFLDAYRGAEVLVNHGDRCAAFAGELREDGFAARAPELGECVTV